MKRNNLAIAICFVLGLLFAGQIDASDNGLNNNNFTAANIESFLESVAPGQYKEIDNGTYSVDCQVGDGTVPMLIAMSEDGECIWASLMLGDLPADFSNDTLLRLLEQSGEKGDYFFKFYTESRTLALQGALQLRGAVNNELLGDHLIRLIELAEETATMWDFNRVTISRSGGKHVGNWHCNSANITVSLDDYRQFEMNSDGELLSGQFQIDGDRFVMIDKSGERVEGNIRFDNANQFTLMVNGDQFVFVRQ